jgi:2,3-dihydroxybenzoate decarboxylase
MIFGGVFDRFPKAKLILGHMGETLPYLLWRFDSQTSLRQKLVKGSATLKKLPSEYIKENMLVTTSGVFSNGPLLCALDALGENSILFSVDYPYESMDAATKFIDEAPISESVREKICYKNAQRILKIQ